MSVSRSRNGAVSRSLVSKLTGLGRAKRLGLMGSSALVGAAMAEMTASSACADPLDLFWTRTVNGAGYDYRFELLLHNRDQTWTAGQNFNWIVFSNHSALTSVNFVGGSSYLPIGPFTNYTTSGGGFGGPTLLDFNNNSRAGFQPPGGIPSSGAATPRSSPHL